MDKKILIVGSGFAAQALREKLEEQGTQAFTSFDADIREDNTCELLEFALKEKIDLTVAFSKKAIQSDIAEFFSVNGQLIFASGQMDVLNRSNGKRILYSARVPTPRFGVFEKASLALDYLNSVDFPVVISSNDDEQMICSTFEPARKFIETLFTHNHEIIISEYVYGHAFTLYFITDGAQFLPIVSVGHDEYFYAPDYKVPQALEAEILDKIAPTLEGCCGIFGADCVLDKGFKVLGLRSFFDEKVASAVLDLINEDLYSLFEACALGAFADDYDHIKMSGNSFAACIMDGKPTSAQGRTLSRALKNLADPTMTKNVFAA